MKYQWVVKAMIIGHLSIYLNFSYGLESIVVSDARFESSIHDTSSMITVISDDQLRLQGVDHIVDALRNGGGIQVSDLFGDGTDANVGLRGFSTSAGQNTLIMIDGRRLNNTDNGLPDLNLLSIDDIEKIELVKSSMSTLYGDKAVGGVINVITKKPDDFHVQAKLNYGSYNNRQIYAAIENRHDSGIDYRLSVQRNLSNNYRDNNAIILTTFNSRGGYQYGAGEVFLEFQTGNEDIALPGALFSDMLTVDRRQALNPDDRIKTDTWASRAGVRHFISDFIEVRFEYTNRFNDIVGIISSAGNAEQFNSKRHHIELTPRINISFNLLGLPAEVYTGIDWFKTDYLIVSRFGLTDNTQTQYGYYGRLTTALTDSLKFIVGARHGVVRNDVLVDTLTFGRSLPEGTELDDGANAYEAGFTYEIAPSWRLFSKIERHFRFVTADEYSAIADNNFFSELFGFGEPVPLPETQLGTSLEAGIGWQNKNNDNLTLQVYRLDINNEIIFDPVLFLNTNLGNTRRNGISLEGKYGLTNDISLSAAYSYLETKFISGRLDGNDLTFLPKHSVRASLNYRIQDNTGIYLEWLGQGKRRFDGDYTNKFRQLSGYSLFNINARHSIKNILLSFRLNNLFNRHYIDSGIIGFDFRKPFPSPLAETYYSAPGRNYMLSLTYNN
jgi:iron complex outermembrane receptor protein